MAEQRSDKYSTERAMIERVKNEDALFTRGDVIHVCQLAERFLDRLESDAVPELQQISAGTLAADDARLFGEKPVSTSDMEFWQNEAGRLEESNRVAQETIADLREKLAAVSTSGALTVNVATTYHGPWTVVDAGVLGNDGKGNYTVPKYTVFKPWVDARGGWHIRSEGGLDKEQADAIAGAMNQIEARRTVALSARQPLEDHGAYPTERRSGKDRRIYDPYAPNAPYRRMGPRRTSDMPRPSAPADTRTKP